MRVAVIGCGMRGRFHLAEIDAMAETQAAGVCDADADRAAAVAREYGVDAVYGDWREMLERTALDAAVVALPHHLHAPAVIDCLDAGLHVLVENPIATTLADADRMAEAGARNARVLMVGASYRYAPACVSAGRLIRDGRIGSPVLAYGTWLGPKWMMPGSTWAGRADRSAGGPVMGYGTHLFDLLEWLVGPIRSIDAGVSNRAVDGVDVEDSAAVLVRFENGALGGFALSWADATDAFRLDTEILGTNGRVVFSPRGVLRVADGESGGLRDEVPADVGEHAMHREFLAAVTQGREPLTHASNARRALACALAAYRSAESCRPVDVKDAASP